MVYPDLYSILENEIPKNSTKTYLTLQDIEGEDFFEKIKSETINNERKDLIKQLDIPNDVLISVNELSVTEDSTNSTISSTKSEDTMVLTSKNVKLKYSYYDKNENYSLLPKPSSIQTKRSTENNSKFNKCIIM